MTVAHVRQQIRDFAVDALDMIADWNTYNTRIYPKTVLPAVAVYSTTEDVIVENETIGTPRRYWRTMDLIVEATVAATDDVQNDVEALLGDIETALGADLTFGALAIDSRLLSIAVSYSTDGQRPLATGVMTYRVEYRTAATAPGVSLT